MRPIFPVGRLLSTPAANSMQGHSGLLPALTLKTDFGYGSGYPGPVRPFHPPRIAAQSSNNTVTFLGLGSLHRREESWRWDDLPRPVRAKRAKNASWSKLRRRIQPDLSNSTKKISSACTPLPCAAFAIETTPRT